MHVEYPELYLDFVNHCSKDFAERREARGNVKLEIRWSNVVRLCSGKHGIYRTLHTLQAHSDRNKMRGTVLLACIGTRGDVQPFCVLGKVLQDAGYNVIIGAHEEFEKFVHSFGLQFGIIGGSMQESLRESVEGKALRKYAKSWTKSYSNISPFFRPLFHVW